MKVVKFGGSSLRDVQRIRAVEVIIGDLMKEEKIAVVVSAFGGVTNDLVKMGEMAATSNKEYVDVWTEVKMRHLKVVQELYEEAGVRDEVLDYVEQLFHELQEILYGVYLTKELTLKTNDYVLSFGERLSAFIVAKYLNSKGMVAEYLDARKVVKTDDNFGGARVEFEMTEKLIKEHFEGRSSLQVITGFIGSTKNDETSTLGRDGSDYTAAIFGGALSASEVQIWTDVDGVMTCDPRKVGDAFPIARMTYEEAMEMSHFGADVIHPPTIQPLMKRNIPILIKNTMNPSFPGTLINGKISLNQYVVKGITSIDEISLLRVQGSNLMEKNTKIYERLFRVCSEYSINVVMISQASSERSICLAIEPEAARRAKLMLDVEFEMEIQMGLLDPVVVDEDFAAVAIVGSNMKNTVGVAGKLFMSFAEAGVSVVAIAQGSSELNISVIISRKDEVAALNSIHKTFFFSEA